MARLVRAGKFIWNAVNTQYNSSRYDDRFILKVSPLLWLVIFYSLRHFLLFLFVSLTKSADLMSLVADVVDPRLMVSDTLALLVLFAYLSRLGENPWPPFRRLWHGGKWLLVAATALNTLLLPLLLWEKIAELDLLPLTLLELNVVIMVYLVRSTLVRDIFADFPAGAVKAP